MTNEYIRKQDVVNIAESYEVKRDGFYLNDYEYGRTQVASSIASDLEDVAPADVVPVVHAHWIDGYRWQTCSKCRNKGKKSWKFCPNCGAKMDGGENG